MKPFPFRHFIISVAVGLAAPAAAVAAITSGVGIPTGPTRSDAYPYAGFGFFAPSGVGTTVNRLGYWDQNGDGLQTPHTVALFSYAGSAAYYNEVISVTIPAGTAAPLENGYRWVTIPTLVLPDNGQNGNYYVVMASHGADLWTDGLGTGAPMNSSIGTLSTGALNRIPDGPVFTINGGGPLLYGGPNVGFDPVPEPSGLLMAGLALAGVSGRRRR